MDEQTAVCEFLGTALLVFFAVGAAVLSSQFIGALGIALAFGFVLLALVYVFGPISGCHLNPAVTLGMLVARRIDLRTAVTYWAAQIVGGIVGAALILLIAEQVPGFRREGAFGTNGYGTRSAIGVSIFGAFVAELILTFLLVFVYLAVSRRVAVVGFGGVAIGVAFAAIHLIGISLTGTGVNPIRSLAPALFAGSPALTQVWLFLVAPLVGGALAAVVHEGIHPALTAARTARAAAAGAEAALAEGDASGHAGRNGGAGGPLGQGQPWTGPGQP
ncbi:MIP/aquaporin family protein [Streptomyces sp. NBC_01190]|uniref:MIP/aquaporin family protein n=1 Tax=Streptomyces sp. NBC_01190 TaxID=2903767 RepID=UPI003865BF1C